MTRGAYMYVLGPGRIPLPESDLRAWGEWHMNMSNRRVAESQVGDVRISTVFTGSDWHDPPRLFETMVFDGALDEQRWRYYTWDEAQEGHDAVVMLVEAAETVQRDKFLQQFLTSKGEP